LTAHLNAYSSGGNPKIAYQLLAVLDADHVLNRASLKQIPDAWVMLFPVPADGNRGFGRTVERFRPSVKPGTRTMPLTPETTFKLFCGAMPRNRSELQNSRLPSRDSYEHPTMSPACALPSSGDYLLPEQVPT
jgi:hypothetical protein